MNSKPITIPLIGMPNPRATDVTAALAASQDQLFVNCLFEKVQNPVTGQTFLACDKRPGAGAAIAAPAASFGTATLNWVGVSNVGYANLSLFYSTTGPASTLYSGTTSLTAVESMTVTSSSYLATMTEVTVNLISTIIFTAADNKAYYLTEAALVTGNTFTADTNSNASLTNVSSLTGLLHGQVITGTNIPANTRISVVGSTVTLMDSSGVAVNATGTTAGVTMTRSILARIVSLAFPGNATLGKTLTGRFLDMNGFVFISDTQGTIWNSDLNSCVNWTSTSFINSSEIPDPGTGIARKGNTICQFGLKGIEFFQNSGAQAGTILVRTGTPVEVGCAAQPGASNAQSILQADDTVYWVGRKAGDEIGVYVLDGLQAKLISPAFVNADITQSSSAYVKLARFSMGGHPILAVTYYATSYYRVWIYQMDVGQWGQWGNPANNVPFWNNIAVVAITAFDKLISVPETGGNAYLIDLKTPIYTDAGVAVTRTIRTRVLDFGTATRKFLSKLRLVGAKTASACNITMTYSDDDYATQSASRTFDMTLADNKLTRLGSFNRRAITLTDAATVNCRLEYLEIPAGGMGVGTS